MESADKLVALTPQNDVHVSFGCSGSEANDFLLKFMHSRNDHKGEFAWRKIISLSV